MCQELQIDINLDEIVELELTSNEEEYDEGELCDRSGTQLILRPLQLAVVAQQEEVITVILKHIIRS